ncbi:hypothetical protein RIF29_15501 [Crotalaria pallida]|uniref:Uncharacterized protein n=1 Tax=Crotalaria pallida TaxID=3830 RepID=A0AAN9FEX8_CROPI
MVWKLGRLLGSLIESSADNINSTNNTAAAVDGFKCIHSVVSMSRIKAKAKASWSDLTGDLFQLILQSLSITHQCKSHARVYAVEGWLAFLNLYCYGRQLLPRLSYSQLSFFNPVSGANRKLPRLPFQSSTIIYFSDLVSHTLVFSSAPHSPDFTVAFLVHFETRRGEPLQLLAFYKRTHK